MRRLDLRDHRTALLATLIICAAAVVPALAAASVTGDQRPPLLAAEKTPDGVAAASRLVDLSVTPGQTGVELVLRGDGGLPYELFSLSAPDRLVFDLPGVAVSTDHKRTEIGANGVIRVRVAQHRGAPDPVARVVLELDHPLAYQIARDGDVMRVHLAELNTNTAAARNTEAERGDEIQAVLAADASHPATDVAAPSRPAPAAAANRRPAALASAERSAKPRPASDTNNRRVAAAPERVPAAVETIPAAVDQAPAGNPEIPPAAQPASVTTNAPAAMNAASNNTTAIVNTTPSNNTTAAASETSHTIARPFHRSAQTATAPAAETQTAPVAQPALDNVQPAPVETTAPRAADIAPVNAPAPTTRPNAELEPTPVAGPRTPSGETAVPFAPAAMGEPTPPPPPVEKEAAGGSATGAMGNPVEKEAAGGSATGGIRLPVAETKTIQDRRRSYTGRPVSLNLMDADIRQVFSLFHELSGLNFVLDPAVSGTVTIVVDEVPWDQALDLILQNNGLEMNIEGNVIRIAPVVKLAQEAAARRSLREAKELEANPVTITRTLSYAKASEVDPVIRQAILSPNGRVIIDNRTNTLIIRDIPDRVEAIDKLLTTLDAETPQVMIEARIVNVSRDYTEDLGIKWGVSAVADPSLGTQTNLQFPNRASMKYALNLPKNPSVNSLALSFGNVLNSFALDVTLDALETQGYAKRLASPKIATQNNEPAEIEQGVRFPIVKTTATEIQTEFVAAALRMKVTPQITAEGTVVLDIEVANDEPDFVNNVAGVPSINTQRARTKVLLPDGGTTVIGGIYAVNEGTSTVGVPFFSKLPGLGWLFRSKNITNKNRELLIFITSRIIKAS